VAPVNPDGDKKNAEDDEEEISAKEATGQKPVRLFVGQNATRAKSISERFEEDDRKHEDDENNGVTDGLLLRSMKSL